MFRKVRSSSGPAHTFYVGAETLERWPLDLIACDDEIYQTPGGVTLAAEPAPAVDDSAEPLIRLAKTARARA